MIDAPPENDDTDLPELVGRPTATIGSTVEFVSQRPRHVMVTRAIDDSVGEDRECFDMSFERPIKTLAFNNIMSRNDLGERRTTFI